jgi:hypothetical protein
MSKRIVNMAAAGLVAGALVFGVVAQVQAAGGNVVDFARGRGGAQATRSIGAAAQSGNFAARLATTATLSAEEQAGLLYMREEEKLAHDVYMALYEQSGLVEFQNIAAAEQTHADAVARLLTRYGIADPASNEAGVFVNADLQALYHDLVAQGSASSVAALRVGALIEETDIADLQAQLAAVTTQDVQRVYGNLLNGSENHLRAFVRALEAAGEAYVPQVLSAAAYETILAEEPGRGPTQTNGMGGRGGNANASASNFGNGNFGNGNFGNGNFGNGNFGNGNFGNGIGLHRPDAVGQGYGIQNGGPLGSNSFGRGR